jgi:predicted HicB family RNase H-like nuclease
VKELFEYKGYSGSIEVSVEDACLHGKVLHIRDLVTYEAVSVQDLRTQFEAAVDSYIQTCARLGVEPKKPYSGTFNVRIGPALHLQAAEIATCKGVCLNDFVKEAIKHEIEKGERQDVHHHFHTFVIKQDIPEIEMPWSKRPDEQITLSRIVTGQGSTVSH